MWMWRVVVKGAAWLSAPREKEATDSHTPTHAWAKPPEAPPPTAWTLNSQSNQKHDMGRKVKHTHLSASIPVMMVPIVPPRPWAGKTSNWSSTCAEFLTQTQAMLQSMAATWWGGWLVGIG